MPERITKKTSIFETLKSMLTFMRERKHLFVLAMRMITAALYGYACIVIILDIFASAKGVVTTIFSSFVALLLISLGILLVIKVVLFLKWIVIYLPAGYLIALYFGFTFTQYLSFTPFLIAVVMVLAALSGPPERKKDVIERIHEDQKDFAESQAHAQKVRAERSEIKELVFLTKDR